MSWADRLQQRFRPAAITIATFKRFGEHNGSRLTSTIAYWSFFSIFPLLLVFVTILNIVLHDRPDTRAELLDGALGQIPVIGTSLGAHQAPIGGSWITVAVGVATALWSGLAAANALQFSLNEIGDVPRNERSNGAVQRVRSLGFLVVLAIAISVSTLASNVNRLIDSAEVLRVLGLLVSLGVNAAVVLYAFVMLTSARRPLRQLLPGVVAAAGGVTLLQLLGTLIVTRYLHGASDTYGTFATVIALLSWLFLLARVTLMGAELNAVLANRLWPRTITDNAPPTPGDARSVALDERRVRRDDRFADVPALDVAATGTPATGTPTAGAAAEQADES